MLKRIEVDLATNDRETDPGKKLSMADKHKLYGAAKNLMAMLNSQDRNRAIVAAAEMAKGKKSPFGYA
jgi:hypothetical protein